MARENLLSSDPIKYLINFLETDSTGVKVYELDPSFSFTLTKITPIGVKIKIFIFYTQ